MQGQSILSNQQSIYQHTTHNQRLLFQNSQIFLKLRKVDFHPFSNKINSLSTDNLNELEALRKGNRQVKPKMIIKLVSWLQKLCKQTMNFSNQTLEIASRILVQFLICEDESVNNLQLLGCACLHLSSKIFEQSIVAAQSYAQCSCNIFTKSELQKKEAQIYSKIGANTNMDSLHNIYQYIKSFEQISQLISDQKDQQIKKILLICIKDIQYLKFNCCILISSIVEVVVNSQSMSLEQNLNQIKQRMLDSQFFNRV